MSDVARRLGEARPRPRLRRRGCRQAGPPEQAVRAGPPGLLFDPGTFVEDAQLANAGAGGLPADGVITGRGLVEGRPAVVVANDPTVKAGSWGARTVEKIIRATEVALANELPIFWLVDSAGARITDQVELSPGGAAGRIFHNQVKLSGPGAADLLPVRALGGGRCLHSGLLRRGVHGRGQRLHVPGFRRAWPRS